MPQVKRATERKVGHEGRVTVKKVDIKKSCTRCNFELKTGKRCSRMVSCDLGCIKYCWQHADIHTRGKECSDTKCHRSWCKKHKKIEVPCTLKGAVFKNKTEYKDWCKIKTRNTTGEKKNRGKRVIKANKELYAQKTLKKNAKKIPIKKVGFKVAIEDVRMYK